MNKFATIISDEAIYAIRINKIIWSGIDEFAKDILNVRLTDDTLAIRFDSEEKCRQVLGDLIETIMGDKNDR